MITYLNMLKNFIEDIFALDFIAGISIHTILFYNILIVTFWVALTRRS